MAKDLNEDIKKVPVYSVSVSSGLPVEENGMSEEFFEKLLIENGIITHKE